MCEAERQLHAAITMRHARVRFVITAAFALVAAVSSPVRTLPEDTDPKGSTAVRVGVVVTNPRNAAVTTLKQTDFELLDDGTPQTIDRVDPPPAVPAARAIGLVLDEYHVQAAETARARDALTRFVDEDVRPNDVVFVLKPLDSLASIRPARDRDEIRRAIAGFEGRMDDYAPRTAFESTYMGRDPDAVEGVRSQIVLSILNALTSTLGERLETRKVILLMSDGFARARIRRDGGLPDVRTVIRTASIFDVGISTFSPGADADRQAADAEAAALTALADGSAGARITASDDLVGALHRVSRDLDDSYTLTYRPSRPDDGRFHAIEVRVKTTGLRVRARAGYASAAPERIHLAAARPDLPDTVSMRTQHRSALVKPWFGFSRGADGRTRVTFTWQPAAISAAGRARPETIVITAKTAAGEPLFTGSVSAVTVTGAAPSPEPERVAFDAPPGTIQLEMAIKSGDNTVLDTDVRDMAVANLTADKTVITEPEVLPTRTARQWAAVVDDADAPPVAAREFSRTERLLIRVPAYGPGQTTATVTATLEGATGQAMRTLPASAGPAPGVTQFDLPLASLAPGDYTIALTATSAAGEARAAFVLSITN
jgi:VWFA-related protein